MDEWSGETDHIGWSQDKRGMVLVGADGDHLTIRDRC